MKTTITTSQSFQAVFPRVESLLTGVSVQSETEYQIDFMTGRTLSSRSAAVSAATVSQKPVRSWLPSLVSSVSSVLIGSALVLGVFLFAPGMYTRLLPTQPTPISATEEGSVLGGEYADGSIAFKPNQVGHAQEAPVEASPEPAPYQAPVNENLPEGSWINIPKIGVRTELLWTDDPNEALETGVWAVPEYGQPGSASEPMIAAAHRFGYQWMWDTDYWRYNTFYLLPETEPGDIIEVIHDQRKWVYEIYAGELNQEITDYDADLILYTCRFLTGADRHIRYARLIDPTAETQAVDTVQE